MQDTSSPLCSWGGSPWHWCPGKQSQAPRHPTGHRGAALQQHTGQGTSRLHYQPSSSLEQPKMRLLYKCFIQHSLIILSFQGCPSPDVHTSHLTSGHSLGCSSCPPFSLAILPSGEEVSQVLCKIMTFFLFDGERNPLVNSKLPRKLLPSSATQA